MNWQRHFLLYFLSLLVLVISFPSCANVQDYRYRKAFKVQRLSIEQGLSASVVQDIIQDKDGYIWVATEDGINRYDSYEFKIFRQDHKDKQSLHENWTLSLAEQPGKGIWVGTVSGVTFLEFTTQKFKNYSNDDKNLKTKIRELTFVENGQLMIASDNGLYIYDEKQDKVIPFESRSGEKLTSAIDSIAESEEYIYVATRSCIVRISKATRALYNLCDLPSLEFMKSKVLNKLLVQQDKLWIGTTKGLFQYDSASEQVKSFLHSDTELYSINGEYIQDLAFDSDGALWIATTNGLDFYNKSKQIFEHYTQTDNPEEGLSANDVLTLRFDNEQLLWLGTYGGGVNILNPNQHKFEHILTKTEVIELGRNNTIHGITKDKDHKLWLASYGGGLLSYDLLSGEISRPFAHNDNDLSSYVYSLFIDYNNLLWVGTQDHLFIVDPENNFEYETELYIDGTVVEIINKVNQIYQDYQGDIFISSESGLYKVRDIEFTSQKATIYLDNITGKLPNTYTNHQQNVVAVLNDQDGNYWIGGPAGLVYYQVGKNTWTHYVHEENNPQSLTSDDVQVIYEDSSGFIWIGTGNGLNRIVRSEVDRDTFYFKRITTYDGLPNNSIYGILEDQQKSLWLSSNLGLVKYVDNSITTDSFKSKDGLSSNEFNTGGYYSDAEGRLYFGSINGVTIVNESSSHQTLDERELTFTRIRIGDRELDMFNINSSSMPEIVQESNEAAIDISVSNITYSKLGTQRYRYRIKGIENKWNYLGTRRNMFIAGLPEGEYQLEIQSQLSGLPWSPRIRTLKILVKTDFWSSSQAYYLMGLLLIIAFAIVLALMARHYTEIVKKNQRKLKLESLRVKELRSDNDALKSELANKEKNIISLNRKVEIGDKQLDVEKYRDVATGFYRLNYLYNLESDDLLNEDQNTTTSFDCYRNMAIIELDNYLSIYEKLGPIAASEFVSQVSVTLRQMSTSGIQVFQVNHGVFLFLGCGIPNSRFEDNLLNLKHIITRSEFGVSNGISENSEVSLTLMNLESINLTSKRQLDVTVDLLVQLHQQIILKATGNSNRIRNHKVMNPKALNETEWQLTELVEKQVIDVDYSI